MGRKNDAVQALQELYTLELPAEQLVPAALEALHAIVPSARNLFDWTDEQGQLLHYYVEGPVDEAIARLYFDEFHNRREAEAMPVFQSLRTLPAGVRSADELNHAGFHRSALYHEIWRPQGFHTRLEGVLRGSRGQLLGSLVLYRGPGDRAFSRDDERRLALVLPGLAAALEACADAPPTRLLVPSPEPPQTLLITPEGQLLHASHAALRLLMLADGGLSAETLARPPMQLAGRLLARLLARLRAAAPSDHARPAVEVVLQHDGPFGRIQASAQWLAPVGRREPPALAQVLLARLESHGVALARALRTLPLTAGQRAVCRELYSGRPQGEIAQRLGVAHATVVDHIRKVYRALQVSSVLELRQRIDQQVGRVAIKPDAG